MSERSVGYYGAPGLCDSGVPEAGPVYGLRLPLMVHSTLTSPTILSSPFFNSKKSNELYGVGSL
jgi:hypothetical protein